jgi:carboxymethylenebutenolidase
VIVIHEIFGLNDDIRRMSARFAALGYVALAPDLYDTDGARVLCIARTLLALRRGSGAAFADLDAARAWLSARPEVDASRIGVAGFCLGGGFALLYAVRAPLGVAAAFYGDVPKTSAELQGVCPVLAGYGGRDRLFAAQGRRLEEHLAALGVPHDVRIYPDAGHSYMSHHTGVLATVSAYGPMAVGHNPAAEADSWSRIERFFGEHLG